MTSEYDLEDVLSDFAMEEPLNHAVLRDYICRYPELALELTDLFHELTLCDLEVQIDAATLETKSVKEVTAKGFAALDAAFSGEGLRAFAKSIGLPRDFLCGFRDAKVRVETVPLPILLGLARKLGVGVHIFLTYLQSRPQNQTALAFKADSKPTPQAALDFETFVGNLGLTEAESAALKRLGERDGSA